MGTRHTLAAPSSFGLAGQKTIPQIVRQEETRRSLSLERGDRRDYIGDHDGFIIALVIRACEHRGALALGLGVECSLRALDFDIYATANTLSQGVAYLLKLRALFA